MRLPSNTARVYKDAMINPTDLRTRMRRNKEGAPVATLPPKDPRDIGPEAVVKQSSIGLPVWLWKRIEEVMKAEGYERNELFREVLRQFVDEHAAKQPKKVSK